MSDLNATIRAILADSREWDADTMKISTSGEVTAFKDADKTFAGNDPVRYVVGHVSDIVDGSGQRREGY